MRAKYRYNKSQRRLFFFMRLLFYCFTDVNVVRVNLQHHVFFFNVAFTRTYLFFFIYVIFSKALGNPNCMAKRKFK